MLAAAAVAMEYCDPANEVRTPAPSVARVMASPPADVTTVNAWPPAAEEDSQPAVQ